MNNNSLNPPPTKQETYINTTKLIRNFQRTEETRLKQSMTTKLKSTFKGRLVIESSQVIVPTEK